MASKSRHEFHEFHENDHCHLDLVGLKYDFSHSLVALLDSTLIAPNAPRRLIATWSVMCNGTRIFTGRGFSTVWQSRNQNLLSDSSRLCVFVVNAVYRMTKINCWRRLGAVTAAALFLSGNPSSSGQGSPGIEIKQHARSVQPGEVVWMEARSPQPLKKLEAAAFKRVFPFYPDNTGLHWEGLIGIDLETSPGSYTVELLGMQDDGTALKLTRTLTVKEKRFVTRHLKVEEKYVTPRPELLERIREESERLRRIFASVTPERLWRGAFVAPVPGSPSSSFGSRSVLNDQPRSPHSGADFHAPTGTPVKAPNAGKVVLAAELYYSGNTVIIDHGFGLYSLFGHLSGFTAKEGEEVPRTKVIGYVGDTGRATGPHLHWAVRLSGTRVDPLSLIAVLAATTTTDIPGAAKPQQANDK